ncbi:MAG TPA: PLP-dependent aminotransferase family protein [Pseudonocardiaceae bacterium]|nr:PLP-dependent aminotransferase family protein [Pseudonocardiaceae bacterium]
MAIEWSSSGLDLHLDWSGDGVADAIRQAVREGRLTAGARLPSTRALAADLGIARGTVTRAYAELAAEGYLRSRQGAPTVVAALSRPRPAPAAVEVPAIRQEWQWNLMPGRPDLTMFPRTAWLAAARRALTDAVAADFGYGDALGHPKLCSALAEYLGRVRGVVATPGLVAVCSGYSQALGLLATALRADGARTIAFEDPSLPECRGVVAAAGLTPVGVPVDEQGIRVDVLADLLAGPDRPAAVVVTPAHQYPLGATLHPHRRAALVELARQTGTLVIEDDYDGEFRFDRQPVGALQAMAPDLVAYAGTASKTLAPGLRLSWLVLPERLVPAVRRTKFFADRHNSVIDQLTFAELLTAGHYDQHVRRCRTRYRRRRDTVLDMVADAGGRIAPAGIAAGLHMVVLLGDDESESDLLARAARRSLLVEGLNRYWMGEGEHPAGIVIGYAAPQEHAFAGALRVLEEILGPTPDRGTH